MPNSPLLYGPNNISNNLQNSILLPNGQQLLNSGPVNLIANSTFENQLTTGWNLGVISSLTNGIPTGTISNGGTTGLTLAIDTSNNLNGLASLSLASSGATVSGNCLYTSTFSVLPAFRAQVMTYKFYYKVQSGASNANFSGTSSNSYGVAAYDVTNSAWLGVAGNFSMTQNSGVGVASGTFQTASNTAQIQFVVYCNVATAGAVTMIFDDFFVGPQTAPIGPVVTDWVAYTPTFTGFGTATAINFRSRRVGDTLEVLGTFTAGTTTAVTAAISLGFNGGNANVTGNIPVLQVVGAGFNNGTTVGQTTSVTAGTTSNLTFAVNTGGLAAYNQLQGSQVLATGGILSIFAKVPIVGWSSNVQMSNDTDTRVISFSGNVGSGQSVTADVTNITVTAVKDTAGAWTGSTYVVPVSGDYVVSGAFAHAAASTQNAKVYKNGTFVPQGWWSSTPATANLTSSGSILVPGCVPGDILSLRSSSTSTVSVASINIFRLSGPAVIAATESVNAAYSNTAGTSVTTSFVTVPFATKLYDSHNAFSGTQYTVPVSGKYRVQVGIATATVTLTTGQLFAAQAVQSGSASVTRLLGTVYGNGAAGNTYQTGGSACFNCNAGDIIVVQDIASTATTLNTTAGNCYFEIERIGN